MLPFTRRIAVAALLLTLTGSLSAQAQSLSHAQLLPRLQKGGLVILMRHANSPREVPDRATANPDNATPERQLDNIGRSTATAMGKAFKELKIPVGNVLSSPTYRALETIKLAQLPAAKTYSELGENGQSMQDANAAQATWLQKQVTQFPKTGNTVIVTHFPNIRAAFPQYSDNLGEGEALVFGPDSKGSVMLLARVKIEDWPTLGK